MFRARVEGSWTPGDADRLTAALVQAMREAQLLVVDEARDRAPGKTGALRRGITAEEPEVVGNTVRGVVGAGGQGAPYAPYLEYGTGARGEEPTGPYVIRPRFKRALAWPAPALGMPGGPFRRLSGTLRTSVRRKLQAGTLRYADVLIVRKRVVHPGIAPRPFLRPAVAAVADRVPDLIDRAVRRALEG